MKWKIESSVESNACYCSYFEQFIHARLIFYSFFDLVIPYQNVITGSSGETADFFLVTYARLLQSFQPTLSFNLSSSIQSTTDRTPTLHYIIFNNPFHLDIHMEEMICRYFRYIAKIHWSSWIYSFEISIHPNTIRYYQIYPD